MNDQIKKGIVKNKNLKNIKSLVWKEDKKRRKWGEKEKSKLFKSLIKWWRRKKKERKRKKERKKERII